MGSDTFALDSVLDLEPVHNGPDVKQAADLLRAGYAHAPGSPLGGGQVGVCAVVVADVLRRSGWRGSRTPRT